jgi:hypothetical protein
MELLRGIVHGRTIELDSESGLPDGQCVTVVVEPALAVAKSVDTLPAGAAMRRAFGAWAADAVELDEFLQWNRRQRHVDRGEMEP